MNRLLFFLIPTLIILILGTFFYSFYKTAQPSAQIRGAKFQLFIAKSEKDKQIGLSKYDRLQESKGMLFLFDKGGLYPFWMKDMRFSIDIIFIRGNKIVTIYENLPTNNLNLYSPTESSDKALEINAGLSKKYNIAVGDTVSFKNIR